MQLTVKSVSPVGVEGCAVTGGEGRHTRGVVIELMLVEDGEVAVLAEAWVGNIVPESLLSLMAKGVARKPTASSGNESRQNDLAGAAMNIADVARAAYTHNFDLLKHYSGLIFQARIAITSVVAATVAVAFGVVPDRQLPESSISGVPARAIVAYVAAIFVVLLYSIEISYLRHFFQVVSCGRAFDKQWRVASYFTKYDRPESWPLHSAYLIGIGLLIVGFLSEVTMGRDLSRDISQRPWRRYRCWRLLPRHADCVDA